jgi:hypothetical protein
MMIVLLRAHFLSAILRLPSAATSALLLHSTARHSTGRLFTTSAVLTAVVLIDVGQSSATLPDLLTTRHSVGRSRTANFRYPCDRVLYPHSGCSCLELRCEAVQCLHFWTDWPLEPVVPSRLCCKFLCDGAVYFAGNLSPPPHRMTLRGGVRPTNSTGMFIHASLAA